MISRRTPSTEIVAIMGERFRELRMAALLTQQEVANLAGVSKTTVYKFEGGMMPNVSLRTILDLMRAVGILEKADDLIPEIPVSPYLIAESGKKVQRIYHKRNGKE